MIIINYTMSEHGVVVSAEPPRYLLYRLLLEYHAHSKFLQQSQSENNNSKIEIPKYPTPSTTNHCNIQALAIRIGYCIGFTILMDIGLPNIYRPHCGKRQYNTIHYNTIFLSLSLTHIPSLFGCVLAPL